MSFTLTLQQRTLADDLRRLLTQFEKNVADEVYWSVQQKILVTFAQKGRALHKSLASDGNEPAHAHHLKDAREVSAEVDFYRHQDSIRSLLRFIDTSDSGSGFKFAFV